MAQLKSDEWPAEKEPTTTEREVPASSPAAHDEASERAAETMKDRLEQFPPVDRTGDDTAGQS